MYHNDEKSHHFVVDVGNVVVMSYDATRHSPALVRYRPHGKSIVFVNDSDRNLRKPDDDETSQAGSIVLGPPNKKGKQCGRAGDERWANGIAPHHVL